jgi:hypothetical protein
MERRHRIDRLRSLRRRALYWIAPLTLLLLGATGAAPTACVTVAAPTGGYASPPGSYTSPPGDPGVQGSPARFAFPKGCEGRTHRDGTRAFGDPNGNCYACPSGFSRTIWHVEAANACERGGFIGIGSEHRTAQYLGPRECGSWRNGRHSGAFEFGSACYECPSGYVPNPDSAGIAPDQDAQACIAR